jgi:hypothetical protein
MQKLSHLLLLTFFVAGSYRTVAQTTASDKAVLLNIHSIGTDRAAVRATRDFWIQVGDQKQEQWYKLTQGYLAEYTEGRTRAQYRYDAKGNWLFCVLTYSEKELAEAVRMLVLSNYFDYKIRWVKEVRNSDARCYVVHIETAEAWKELVVHDGEMRVLHEYNF